jgi:hypothetical protein
VFINGRGKAGHDLVVDVVKEVEEAAEEKYGW